MSGRSQVGGEYRAEVGLSTWELDLWGRVRNLEDAALQRWLASDAARQAVHLALIAQVADGYLGLRGYRPSNRRDPRGVLSHFPAPR